MRKVLPWFAVAVGLFGFAPNSQAIEYVKICTQMPGVTLPAGFYYIPGSDTCFNPTTGEALQPIAISETKVIVWKTILPYPEGKYVVDPAKACGRGSLVKVGDFKSSDFVPDGFLKLRTPPFTLQLKSTQMITKVVMSGGFYDPRAPARQGSGLTNAGMCLRSMDPTVLETQPSGPAINPPYGNGGLPIGCIANGKIVNMPAGYAVAANAAYPNVDAYFVNGDNKTPIAGPYQYGKALVVTTDWGRFDLASLTYCNPEVGGGDCRGGRYDFENQTFSPLTDSQFPRAGTLSVWVCVQDGSSSNGQSQNGQGQNEQSQNGQ